MKMDEKEFIRRQTVNRMEIVLIGSIAIMALFFLAIHFEVIP
jgi:hypothetical protein